MAPLQPADLDGAADELFAQASKLHAQADMQAAEASYRAALQLAPKHADAQHMLGVLLVQLHGKHKYEEARLLVQSAINSRPCCAKFRQSLGVLHQTCGHSRDAVDAFERANEKDPMNVKTLLYLGRALRDVGRNVRAAEVYRSVTLLEPDHPRAHYYRGSCLRAVGRNEEALAALRQHLRLFPEDQQTRFWIAAMSGDSAAMQSMPAGLVADLFDQYADRFDNHLVNHLQYRTPQLLMDAILLASGRGCSAAAAAAGAGAGCSPAPPAPTPRCSWQRAVDLGCGTGLMGPLLRPYVSGVLEGVDLSAAMVDKARDRGCYDRLAVAELVEHIEQCSSQAIASSNSSAEPSNGTSSRSSPAGPQAAAAKYGLLVAADVFVYIGNLEQVMRSAAKHSSPGALFAFSTEALEGRAAEEPQPGCGSSTAAASCTSAPDPGAAGLQGSGPGYSLTVSGRYVHSQAYLRRVAEACSWRPLLLSTEVIRCNCGKPVYGHLCVLQRGEE